MFALLHVVDCHIVKTSPFTVSPESTLQESPLSKWFNVDAIKKSPPAPTNDPAAKGKVISVEDLERSQK